MADSKGMCNQIIQQRVASRLKAVEKTFKTHSEEISKLTAVVETLTIKLSEIPIKIEEKTKLIEAIRNPEIKQPRRVFVRMSPPRKTPAKIWEDEQLTDKEPVIVEEIPVTSNPDASPEIQNRSNDSFGDADDFLNQPLFSGEPPDLDEDDLELPPVPDVLEQCSQPDPQEHKPMPKPITETVQKRDPVVQSQTIKKPQEMKRPSQIGKPSAIPLKSRTPPPKSRPSIQKSSEVSPEEKKITKPTVLDRKPSMIGSPKSPSPKKEIIVAPKQHAPTPPIVIEAIPEVPLKEVLNEFPEPVSQIVVEECESSILEEAQTELSKADESAPEEVKEQEQRDEAPIKETPTKPPPSQMQDAQISESPPSQIQEIVSDQSPQQDPEPIVSSGHFESSDGEASSIESADIVHNEDESELQRLESEIQELLIVAGEERCNKATTFTLSLGSKSAVTLLHTINIGQFCGMELNSDVVWCFRLLFLLAAEQLPEDESAGWEVIKTWLSDKESTLDQKINQKFELFDFSDENIDNLEKLVEGNRNKIDPAYFNQFNAMASFLMFALKDAAEYAGLLPEKRTPWRHYQRLMHKKNKLVSG